MSIYLRGDIWWMEYRTSTVRKRISTGFRKGQKAQAKAAFEAFRLGMAQKPKKSAMEGILSAIYDDAPQSNGIPLGAAWAIFDDWSRGKGRMASKMTQTNTRNLFDRFLGFAAERKAYDMADVTVHLARAFVASLRDNDLSNKTQRSYCGYLSQIWKAVAQMRPGLHNPWPAACPVNDGSSVRHAAFSDDQISAILAAAKKTGCDWHLACTIALYTGLRYGDIATMQWSSINLVERTIRVTPSKTQKSSGISVLIPIAPALYPLLESGGEGYVLPAHGHRYPKPVDVPFAAILAAVGLTGRQYGFHCWRHTANTRMSEAGVPSNVRQMLCGWTSGAMAAHYDHSAHLAELRAAVGRI